MDCGRHALADINEQRRAWGGVINSAPFASLSRRILFFVTCLRSFCEQWPVVHLESDPLPRRKSDRNLQKSNLAPAMLSPFSRP